MASSRRKRSSAKEGGRNARPLGAVAKVFIALFVAAMLLFAFNQAGTPQLIDSFRNQDDGQSQNPEDVRQIDWDSLPADIVAWVEIPGTNVDEPVAQGTSDSPDYYLYHDALDQGALGTPYIDWECAPDSKYVSVYGHHMDDGSVFADIAKFSDRDYAEEHVSIYWYTRADNKRHELKVVAVDVLNASYETQRTSFKDDADRIAYLKEKLSASDLILAEPSLEYGQLISFATCSYQTRNSRTVVFAYSQ